MFAGLGRAFLRAFSRFRGKRSLAGLGNSGTWARLRALFVWELESCKGRGERSPSSWTKVTQKLDSQLAPTLFLGGLGGFEH